MLFRGLCHRENVQIHVVQLIEDSDQCSLIWQIAGQHGYVIVWIVVYRQPIKPFLPAGIQIASHLDLDMKGEV